MAKKETRPEETTVANGHDNQRGQVMAIDFN